MIYLVCIFIWQYLGKMTEALPKSMYVLFIASHLYTRLATLSKETRFVWSVLTNCYLWRCYFLGACKLLLNNLFWNLWQDFKLNTKLLPKVFKVWGFFSLCLNARYWLCFPALVLLRIFFLISLNFLRWSLEVQRVFQLLL